MMIKHHTLRLLLLVMVVFFGMSQSGWSLITVGPLPGDSVQTDLAYSGSGPANYVLPMTEVAWSQTGPYWLKNLLGTGRPILTEGTSLNTLTMIENLTVGGRVGWTDWHEVFVTDGLSWDQATIVFTGTQTVLPGLTTQISNGGGEDIHNDNVDFFFDQLPVGTQITVVKRMIWQGLDVSMGTEQLGTDTIVIREFPTVTVIPEPGTLALLAIGGGIFGLLRRRRLI